MKTFENNFKLSWKQFLSKMFKMSGKSSRTEYNSVMIPILFIFGALMGIADYLFLHDHIIIGLYLRWVALLYILIVFICSFCLVARRNQDVGISKWYVILMFLPQLGYLYLIILMMLSSNVKAHLHFFPFHHHKYLHE